MPEDPGRPRPRVVRTPALRVAGLYAVAGAAWILLSDRALAVFVADPALQFSLQTAKGWAFVAVSAAFIAWLVRREVMRLHRAESRSLAIMRQNLVGTYLIQDGCLVQANERLAEVFGYAPGDLLGRPVLSVVAPEDRDRVLASIEERIFGDRDEVTYRFRGLRADDSTVDVEVHGRRVEWEGQPAVAGVLLDISERTKLEDQIRQKGRLEALGSLTGAVVHDFNNYLTGIQGSLELLLYDPDAQPAVVREGLRVAHDSARRAAALTNKLRSFSRARINRHRELDLADYFRRVEGFLRSIYGSGQGFRFEIDPDLPPVRIDPTALDQVLINLIVNAKEATGSDVQIAVRARLARDPPRVAIEVSDNGPGMPPDVYARVLEPFFTTKEGGTGLGLATVNALARECGGTLEIESEVDRGTTVRLVLPVALGRAARTALAESRDPLSPIRAPASILVVEDDTAVRRVFVAGLTRMGHRITAVGTAAEAVHAMEARGGGFDLVIVDVNLPDQPGPRLYARLKQLDPDLRPLFTSGYRPSEMEEYAEALAGHPFLEKPFSLEDLAAALQEALAASA